MVLPKGRHDFPGEKAHGFFDFFVGDAAEVEGRSQSIKIIVAHGVVDNLDALIGIAVKITAHREHPIPIVIGRFGHRRFATDSGDGVVAGDCGRCCFPRARTIFINVSSDVKLATALRWVYAVLD